MDSATHAHPPTGEVIRPTTFIEAPRLARRLGVDLILASETFQHTGSFKFRAAYHVAATVPHRRLLTASSGNFGQALARACQLLGKSCLVAMPAHSSRAKMDAVREFGGEIDLIDVNRTTRADRVRELAAQRPDAYVASPYDDPLVIEGNATLGRELAAVCRPDTVVVVPVGGGGLSAGILSGLRSAGCQATVHGVEPQLANDAARSMRAGRIVVNPTEPDTIADGARTASLGEANWAILRNGLAGIIEVSEDEIREAVRVLFHLANLKVEPTGALAIAAMLAAPAAFQGRSVCCIASGGNVDAEVYRQILQG